MKKEVKKLKKKEIKIKSDVLVRSSLSVLFTSIFIVLFFVCGGLLYFYNVVIVDKFQGYDFQVHFIDVGQGDSILIKFPNEQTMLIDAGEEDEGETVTAYVNNFLKNEGLSYLDYLVLTHPDADHIGGAIEVLESIQVATVFRPKVYTPEEAADMSSENIMISTTQTYDRVISLVTEKGCNIIYNKQGIELNLGGCQVEFLSPASDYYSSTNSISAVIMMTYQTKKFLFTGDADATIENTLITQYGDYLKADVLKVAHHGSSSSSTEEFLQLVRPEYAVLCVAQNRDLPSVEVLNRLHDINSQILTTSSNGGIAMTVENDSIVYATAPVPTIDIALLISIYVLLLIFTWGIRKKEKPKRPKNVIRDNKENNSDI